MGIPKLESELWHLPGCVNSVSIPELVEKYGRNIIVVDGFQFYGLYLYPKFDWVCGAIRELIREVRDFVEAFERVGVKLVFFFVEGNLDEGADRCGSESWIERRSSFIEYTQKFFEEFPRSARAWNLAKKGRGYYHTPLNALHVILFALRHIFHCDVHLVYSGDRCDSIAHYTRNNACLGILAQDNYYLFYRGVPCYLSIKNLILKDMTTVRYCPKALARHKKLEGNLYPFFLKEKSLTPQHRETLLKISMKLEECGNSDVARKNITESFKGKKIDALEVGEPSIEETVKFQFLFDVLRYNFGFAYLNVYGPLKKWELIKLRAQELYASGQMSKEIQQIFMSKKYYNECILEDFTELPPSSLVYLPLRKKLYGILFHEAPKYHTVQRSEVGESNAIASESSDVELQPGALNVWQRKLYDVVGNEEPHKSEEILEWHMSKQGCLSLPVPVTPTYVNPELHPGLLCLWDVNNETSGIQDKKWQLFASCISDNLHWQLLCSLPPTLVVPTVVLYYLFQIVPSMFQSRSWKCLQPWEVEVFVAQAVMLPRLSADSLSQFTIKNINPRVVKLMAFFVYGCHYVRLLIEVCGYPISEHDLCLFHFFDGKLLHSFYNRAEWRRSALSLYDKESSPVFQQMKDIIICDTDVRSLRK